MEESQAQALDQAARALAEADALLVTAGAGMGVDSGLPDFRGEEGFRKAYPPYRHLNVSFLDVANPAWFERDPNFAWGFYGHRRNLYRDTAPHEGFSILRRWGEELPEGYRVYTSNVDGHFQKAGFDKTRVVECHGSIEWNQCMEGCSREIFPAGTEAIELDTERMRARPPLPGCPACGGLARPNILMFGDFGWCGDRQTEQSFHMARWLERVQESRLVVVEIGAGTTIPSVRMFTEQLSWSDGQVTLIRINPREPEVPKGHISLMGGALEMLRRLDGHSSG